MPMIKMASKRFLNEIELDSSSIDVDQKRPNTAKFTFKRFSHSTFKNIFARLTSKQNNLLSSTKTNAKQHKNSFMKKSNLKQSDSSDTINNKYRVKFEQDVMVYQLPGQSEESENKLDNKIDYESPMVLMRQSVSRHSLDQHKPCNLCKNRGLYQFDDFYDPTDMIYDKISLSSPKSATPTNYFDIFQKKKLNGSLFDLRRLRYASPPKVPTSTRITNFISK
jgi:hypothetical protein